MSVIFSAVNSSGWGLGLSWLRTAVESKSNAPATAAIFFNDFIAFSRRDRIPFCACALETPLAAIAFSAPPRRPLMQAPRLLLVRAAEFRAALLRWVRQVAVENREVPRARLGR